MTSGLACFEQYLNAKAIFTYDAYDRRLKWKRKNKARLERSHEKGTLLFFTWSKISITTAIKLRPIPISLPGREFLMPFKTSSLEREK